MRESIKTVFSVISPHPTGTHSSKRQRIESEVHDDIIDCHTTAGCLVNHPSNELIIMRKYTESQGLSTFIYEIYGFICIFHRHYWKNWSKNFFFHHSGLRINISKYCWGYVARGLISLPTKSSFVLQANFVSSENDDD